MSRLSLVQSRTSPRILTQVLTLANRVMKDLGKGHRENIYAKALVVAMNQSGVPHRHEVDIPIMYLGQCVGHGRADLIVGNLIVEVKAVSRHPQEALGQIQKYVSNLSKVEGRAFEGVILNFSQSIGKVQAYTMEEEDLDEISEEDEHVHQEAPAKRKRGRPPQNPSPPPPQVKSRFFTQTTRNYHK